MTLLKGEANILNKSTDSADNNLDSRKRNFYLEWLLKELAAVLGAVQSLRLWTFFSTFASLYRIEHTISESGG